MAKLTSLLPFTLVFFKSILAQPSLTEQFDERLTFLENKVASLRSRILTLEYAFKDLNGSSPSASSQTTNPPTVVLINNGAFSPPEENIKSAVSTNKPITSVDKGDFRPKDCSEIMEELDYKQRLSTFYTIYPISRDRPLEVYCDMDTFNGGWTVIQRRGFEGAHREDFNRTWKEYSKGFGQMDGDYWIGLENIHALTKYDDQEVLFEFLQIQDGRKIIKYINYGKFQIEDAANLYRLHLSGLNERFSTELTYYLEKQDSLAFSTRDKDNAGTNNRNCRHHSGWWLQSIVCHRQPDLNMPFDRDILHLHKFKVVQDRHGVSIKIREKRNLIAKN